VHRAAIVTDRHSASVRDHGPERDEVTGITALVPQERNIGREPGLGRSTDENALRRKRPSKLLGIRERPRPEVVGRPHDDRDNRLRDVDAEPGQVAARSLERFGTGHERRFPRQSVPRQWLAERLGDDPTAG